MVAKISKLIIIILVVVLLGATVFCVVAPQKETPTILIVPGMLASQLVMGEKETPVWEPFGTIDLKNMQSITSLLLNPRTTELLEDLISASENSILKLLAPDENGKVKNNGIHPASMSSLPDMRYGIFKMYKPIFDSLTENFGKTCKIDIMQYDWRLDNRENGQKMEQYIEKKGYKNIIICAHSMGNLVTSSYLSRSQNNRDKVKGFISMAAPYYGSMMALSILENQDGILKTIQDVLYKIPVLYNMLGNTVQTIYDQQFKPLLQNLITLPQLLPTIELAIDLKKAYGSSFVTVDGKDITTQQQLNQFYATRPWSVKSNGEIKPFIKNLNEYNDSFYVVKNGKKYHSSKLVNTVYMVGNDVKTETVIKIQNDKFAGSVHSQLGDGTVPLHSALLGNSIYASNVKVYNGYEHLDLGCAFEGIYQRDVLAFIRYLL